MAKAAPKTAYFAVFGVLKKITMTSLMPYPSHSMKNQIEKTIPISKIMNDIKAFLEKCNWELEIGERLVKIPKNEELFVQTRAYILANAPDIFLGNHYESVVLLGYEELDDNIIPKYGYLRMYYDEEGHFISEDRYDKYEN